MKTTALKGKLTFGDPLLDSGVGAQAVQLPIGLNLHVTNPGRYIQGYLAQIETAPPKDPTVGLSLGP